MLKKPMMYMKLMNPYNNTKSYRADDILSRDEFFSSIGKNVIHIDIDNSLEYTLYQAYKVIAEYFNIIQLNLLINLSKHYKELPTILLLKYAIPFKSYSVMIEKQGEDDDYIVKKFFELFGEKIHSNCHKDGLESVVDPFIYDSELCLEFLNMTNINELENELEKLNIKEDIDYKYKNSKLLLTDEAFDLIFMNANSKTGKKIRKVFYYVKQLLYKVINALGKEKEASLAKDKLIEELKSKEELYKKQNEELKEFNKKSEISIKRLKER